MPCLVKCSDVSLMEPAQLIQQVHPEKEDIEYTLSIEAREVDAFDFRGIYLGKCFPVY